ncbi:MAG: hypothetical protein NTX86_05795 [Candidatus Dependentiae bacterium]|nr:hypothetical protein [Candidatus Dependentiae bacterium]
MKTMLKIALIFFSIMPIIVFNAMGPRTVTAHSHERAPDETRSVAKMKALTAAAQGYKMQLQKVTSQIATIIEALIQEHFDHIQEQLGSVSNTTHNEVSALLVSITKDFEAIHTKVSSYLNITNAVMTKQDLTSSAKTAQELLNNFFRTVASCQQILSTDTFKKLDAWCTKYSGKFDELFNHE